MAARIRRTRIRVLLAETRAGWARSELKFIQFEGNMRREVVIEIDSPAALSYIRDQLDQIVDEWHSQLNSLTK